jgi:N-acetylmuramic acid 6-phosphate etherase
MVDMQLANTKLIERATKMIVQELSVSETEAQKLLEQYGNVRKVLENYQNKLQ